MYQDKLNFITFPETKTRVENMTCSGVFLMNFEMWNVFSIKTKTHDENSEIKYYISVLVKIRYTKHYVITVMMSPLMKRYRVWEGIIECVIALDICTLHVYLPGLEKYLNSTWPVGQVTLKFCLPGALPGLPKFSNSLIIHKPKNGSQQACFNVINPSWL